MGRKRPHPRTKPPQDRRPGKPESQPPPLPSMRASEAVLRTLTNALSGRPASDGVLDRAQALVYRAFETPDQNEQITLARQALDLSPECADAYVLLAEAAVTEAEKLALYEQGVAAGERALGPRAFQEDVGHFWGVLETRPYMRARLGLAHALSGMGRPDEAIRHMQEMVRLNPGDNQGVRYDLVSRLIQLDRDQEASALIAQYDEPTAAWSFSRALLAFRSEGDTPESRRLFKRAHAENRAVPSFLLRERPLPPQPPDRYSIGSTEEAIIYAGNALSVWRSTPGALSWIKEITGRGARPPATDKAPIGPSRLAKERLKRLPQTDTVAEAGVRRFPKWLMDEGEQRLAWVIMMVDPGTELIVTTKLFIEEPTVDRVWDLIASALGQDDAGPGSRPARIKVLAQPLWTALAPHWHDVGIELEICDELPFLESVFADMNQKMTQGEPPGLLDVPRVKPETVAGLFSAAAEFYRRAPWRYLCDSHVLKVECTCFESGPWYAVIMGQSGITLGVALDDDLAMVRDLWNDDSDVRKSNRRMSALAVTFDDETGANAKDLVAASERSWEVVHSEVFPIVYRKELGLKLRPPLAWELTLLEGCLRAIPGYLTDHRPGDPSRTLLTVPTAARTLELTLSWVE